MAVRIRMLSLAALAALFVVPGSAVAKPCPGHSNAPAGNSESQQYSETIPGACGDQTPPSGSGGGSPNAIPPGTLEQLQTMGADGRAAAALAEQTAPGGKVPPRDRNAANRGANAAGGGTGGGGIGSVFDALTGAIGGSSDDGGMGLLLPLILAAIAGAGITAAIVRRRAGQTR